MSLLHVAFTMDCERIAAESPPGGPESWEVSERAIRGYCQRLLDQGYKPTLFLTPECGRQHADLLARLAEQGVELGLHVHPQSLGDHRYERYLGEYEAAMQREIIGLATEMLTQAIGRRPVSFRPGNFSASDATYGVLYALGFRQGSVSDPGRHVPQFAADWRGACLDPHYVDAANRLCGGQLPFLEVPLTTDPERLQPNGFPYELRIENGPFENWHRPIMERYLQRLQEEQVGFAALCLFTHNYFAYDQADDPRSYAMQGILDYLDDIAAAQAVVPVTPEEAHAWFKTWKRRG